jgi:Na+-driven multidrug efflux pump
MLLTYLLIALIILSLIILILGFVAIQAIRKNTNFSTNTKLQSASDWCIGIIVTSILSVFFSIASLIVLKSHGNHKTGTFITLLALELFTTFAIFVFCIITVANFENIYVIIALVLAFITFIIIVLAFFQGRKLEVYIAPSLANALCTTNVPTLVVTQPSIPEPVYYVSNIQTIEQLTL